MGHMPVILGIWRQENQDFEFSFVYIRMRSQFRLHKPHLSLKTKQKSKKTLVILEDLNLGC